MKIIRVFPRRTNATPDDENVRIGFPGIFDEADKIYISITFKWHLPDVELLEKSWKYIAPVTIGGPACGDSGGEFIPGKYLKHGYVITTRGCPNTCWFCDVWKREGNIRELPIAKGRNVLDNNLLAASDKHINLVFDMLEKESSVEFTGGLEAARLKSWHVERLVKTKPKQIFFAYDTPGDFKPLTEAGNLLLSKGFKRNGVLRCYVLFGYDGDTPEKAHARFINTMKIGFMPMAMFYRKDSFRPITKEWHDLQWLYSRPAAMRKEYTNLNRRSIKEGGGEK